MNGWPRSRNRVARLEENSVDVLQAFDRIERRLDKPSQAR